VSELGEWILRSWPVRLVVVGWQRNRIV
jgi:hypothetical protein